MSTILKALRRLEDDQAPDPTPPDVLRERILAEELAAHAGLGGNEESTLRSAALLAFLKHRGPALATAVILLGASLVIGISLGTPDRDSSVNGQTNAQSNAQSNGLATAGSTRQPVAAAGSPAPAPGPASTQRPASFAVRPAPPTPGPNAIVASAPSSVLKPPTPPSAEPTSVPPARVALRPVEGVKRPTTNASPVSRRPPIPIAALPMGSPPALVAKLEASSPASPPPPVEVALAKKPAGSPVPWPSPRPALVAAPRVDASSNVEAGSLRPALTPKAKPTRAVPEIVRRKTPVGLPRIAKPAIPDVSILRTAWHPQPERRSARIQLAKSEDVLTLREGDAVGSLVVKEITPSSVLFAAGDVELRRRVGN